MCDSQKTTESSGSTRSTRAIRRAQQQQEKNDPPPQTVTKSVKLSSPAKPESSSVKPESSSPVKPELTPTERRSKRTRVVSTRSGNKSENASQPKRLKPGRKKKVLLTELVDRPELSIDDILSNLKTKGYIVTAVADDVSVQRMSESLEDDLKSNKFVKVFPGTSKVKSINGSQNNDESDYFDPCERPVENKGMYAKYKFCDYFVEQKRRTALDFQKTDRKLRLDTTVLVRSIPQKLYSLLESRALLKVDLIEIISVKPQPHEIPKEYINKLDNKDADEDHVCRRECGSSSSLCLPTEKNRLLSPLALPFYHGWTRGTFTSRQKKGGYKTRLGAKVYYKTPCGVKMTKYDSVRKYLSLTLSPLEMESFCFQTKVNCLLELPPSTRTSFFVFEEDISNGQEIRNVERVNSLDLEPAGALEYVANSVFGPNITPEESEKLTYFFSCCDCEDDCRDRTKCSCWQLTLENEAVINPKATLPYTGSSRNTVGYTDKKLLPKKVEGGIFECNPRCKCKSSCINRVVQKGLRWRVQVFKTKNRGYSVRAMEEIPQGAFVCIYAGELINNVHADRVVVHGGTGYAVELLSGFQEKHVDAFTHWMDEHKNLSPLQEVRQQLLSAGGTVDERFVVDAKRKGSLGRYFNHSCRPNLFVQPVFVDTHDLRLPRAAFFTTEVIKCGTEMGWDYGYEVGTFPGNEKVCHCGSIGCRGRFL